MPLSGKAQQVVELPYFSSLAELDSWAITPKKKLEGILDYIPRPLLSEPRSDGKLMVCHDYKGGYKETPSALSYTFNFWTSSDTFVYFSHHRVTIPPPGWITAAHRQGVKILGTLIFEHGAEEDCLRLLVGNLPRSVNGPARPVIPKTSLPLSPHYARLLAQLAYQRGFDGYLLNFECPLQGGVEQTRALAAWITLLQSEILAKVGRHGETIWYDSVVYTGQLAWQDRLNSFNLPFFLPSTGIFTNYTWRCDYPNTTAQYFLTLDPALTGNTSDSQPHVSKKSLNDIYVGVDVWGRGSHGGGGFGSYKAISHIAPDSLGLSVALFGQAWTWESEQDKAGWNWKKWWDYETRLWVGPVTGEVEVPKAPEHKDEPECIHGPFLPISSFFPRQPPPDPYNLPFHTTFSPGVGHAWFVDGVRVHWRDNGWTDIDKQCSLGNMIWPRPRLEWEGGERDDPPLDGLAHIYFEDAWNGGNSLRLTLSCKGSEAEDAVSRCVWLPIQSIAIKPGRHYEVTMIYKSGSGIDALDLDISLSVKLAGEGEGSLQITPISIADTDLPGDWTKLSIQFVVSEVQAASISTTATIGLVITIVTEDPSQPLDMIFFLGQLNVYAVPPETSPTYYPMLLWADYAPPQSLNTTSSLSTVGTLIWETAASFPPLNNISITAPDDPISPWKTYPSDRWLPSFVYFNIYALKYSPDGKIGQPENAVWVGTTGLDGMRNSYAIVPENIPFWPTESITDHFKVRFFVQGVDDRGRILRWEDCVFVDCNLTTTVT